MGLISTLLKDFNTIDKSSSVNGRLTEGLRSVTIIFKPGTKPIKTPKLVKRAKSN